MGYGRMEIANNAIPTLPQPRLLRVYPPNPSAYGVRILGARSIHGHTKRILQFLHLAFVYLPSQRTNIRHSEIKVLFRLFLMQQAPTFHLQQ